LLLAASILLLGAPAAGAKGGSSSSALPVVPQPIPPDGPSQIGVGIYVIDVSSVDTTNEQFTATFDLSFRCLDHCQQLGSGWTITNATVSSDQQTLQEPALVVYQVQAKMDANFDISSFPFDSQVLPIRIQATLNNVQRQVYEPDPDPQYTGFGHNVVIPGWTRKATVASTMPVYDPQTADQYSQVTFDIHVTRASRVAFFKYLLPVILLLALNLIVLAPAKWLSPKDRVPLASAGLILAVVTEIATLAVLPDKGGFTFLDAFTILSVVCFLALMIEPMIEMTMQDSKGNDKEEHAEKRQRLNLWWRRLAPPVIIMLYILLFLLAI
jgi:hypothetical protein